ncbi:MAG: hypothetical protein IT481_08130 [Gammaproteobacteria bacterium]|nr:hypothetical protein [Gammaproteobacteria bacterium]
MDDIRRLTALRARARAGFYCCQYATTRLVDTRLRATFEQAAAARWRLARALDTFLTSQPWEDRSRLAPTPYDRLARLLRCGRAALALDRDRNALRWLAADAARLRHAVEICRGLSWSLEISDLLTPRLDELKQAQRAIAGLATMVRERRDTPATVPLATA